MTKHDAFKKKLLKNTFTLHLEFLTILNDSCEDAYYFIA